MVKIKPTLNQADIVLIQTLMRAAINEAVPLIVKNEVGKQLGNYPTKDDFYKMMDKLFGEQKTIRENENILNHRTSDHEDRLQKIEKIHPNFSHT
jgi:hypothetical protein